MPTYNSLITRADADALIPTQQAAEVVKALTAASAVLSLCKTTTMSSKVTQQPVLSALPVAFDMSLPENQRKLEAVEQLAQVAGDAGVSLIELAIAFVINHPGVTSAIIGPRTMEQLDSQVPAADVQLDDAVLDRIDEIVKPGVVLNPADTSYGERVLEPALRRREH